jgi:DNA-binding LytR/AlgR family response regulator
MSVRTLIVDDEPIARAVLREELEQFDQVEIVGEAESGIEALQMIESTQPSLVFLDLQMPGMSGFEVVRRIGGGPRLPLFIVVTAYDQYAIQAFEAGAIDYLLKPVGQKRLEAAMEKANRVLVQADGPARNLAALQDVADAAGSSKAIKRIVAKSGAEYLLLTTDEVFAFQAEGDLVWIITARKRLLATETLGRIQEKLQGGSFKRIHRKALVNIDHVRKMSPLSSQRWLLTLSNNLEFIVSKRQAKTVREILSG